MCVSNSNTLAGPKVFWVARSASVGDDHYQRGYQDYDHYRVTIKARALVLVTTTTRQSILLSGSP